MDDIFDLGILSNSCQTNCNCRKQYETQDSLGQSDRNGNNGKQ